ncbi:MAG: hypothetical protein R3325_12100 [Thermoanaerobaculia bacterium]|nr:hypothetical protein [Thermoanaerobaculia bacterium]
MRGASAGRAAAALLVALAVPAAAAGQGRAAAALDLIEQHPASEEAAPAALALGHRWILDGEWVAGAGLLQQSLELATRSGQEEVARAARSRLAAVDRLLLRPAAGRERWPSARWLATRQVELGRPVGVAARGDGDLVVVDEGRDQVVRIALGDGSERARPVRKARRAVFTPEGEVLVIDRDGGAARLGGGPVGWPPTGLRDTVDVAAGPSGGWLGLTAAGQVVRLADDGSGREPVKLDGAPRATALDVDPLGNLYLLDEDAQRVVVFDRLGERIAVIGPRLPGGLELKRPEDLAVDDSGRLYVADRRQGVAVLE